MNIVVFASGNGSTLQAVIDSIKNGMLDVKIVLVVSNNADAYALDRAREENIDTYLIQGKTTEEIDNELVDVLSSYDVDLVLLAGYLKLIGGRMLSNYTIINTHPSLLPKFGGKGMYGHHVHEAVIEAKEEYSGVTLHYVNEDYDKGAFIKQSKVKIEENDNAETLSAKVQEVEKKQLIEGLQELSYNIRKEKAK